MAIENQLEVARVLHTVKVKVPEPPKPVKIFRCLQMELKAMGLVESST